MRAPEHSLEEDFLAWKERMWPVVCKFFNKDPDAASQLTYVAGCRASRTLGRRAC